MSIKLNKLYKTERERKKRKEHEEEEKNAKVQLMRKKNIIFCLFVINQIFSFTRLK